MDNDLWHKWNGMANGKVKDGLLNKLARDNMPLVYKLVNKLLARTSVFIELDDAVQAGAIGLLRAIRGHDPNRGTKFSTYATHWVRHEVQNCLLHQTQLYRPRGTGMPYKEHRINETIEAAFGREATAQELGVSETQLEKWRSVIFHFVPIDESGERLTEFGTSLAYKNMSALADDQSSPDIKLEEAEFNQKLTRAIGTMTEIERDVVLYDRRVPNAKIIRESAISKVKARLCED